MTIEDLSKAIGLVAEIQGHLDSSSFDLALHKVRNLRAVLNQVRAADTYDADTVSGFRTAISHVGTIANRLETPDRSGINTKFVHGKLSGISDFLTQLVTKIRLDTGGE